VKREKDPFPLDAYKRLAAAEGSSWWFLSRNKIIVWALQKYNSDFKEFLEIGCGTGFVLKEIRKSFPDIKLHATEYFEEGLIYAKKRVPDAEFRVLDATKMKDLNLYNAVGAFDVIEHIKDDELALKNISNALKQEGNLFLTVPQHKWLWSAIDESSFHVRRYTKEDLIIKVENAGFEIIYTSSFITFLLPFMWISRLGNRKSTLKSKGEFKIARWLNKCFELIMFLEIWLLKLGVKYPFGGSLLLIAKKI